MNAATVGWPKHRMRRQGLSTPSHIHRRYRKCSALLCSVLSCPAVPCSPEIRFRGSKALCVRDNWNQRNRGQVTTQFRYLGMQSTLRSVLEVYWSACPLVVDIRVLWISRMQTKVVKSASIKTAIKEDGTHHPRQVHSEDRGVCR